MDHIGFPRGYLIIHPHIRLSWLCLYFSGDTGLQPRTKRACSVPTAAPWWVCMGFHSHLSGICTGAVDRLTVHLCNTSSVGGWVCQIWNPCAPSGRNGTGELPLPPSRTGPSSYTFGIPWALTGVFGCLLSPPFARSSSLSRLSSGSDDMTRCTCTSSGRRGDCTHFERLAGLLPSHG